jgi:hypothetical protein
MWSVGGAVLIWVAICAGVVVLALRRLRREIEPALRSFELLHDDVATALTAAGRDAGRAGASRRVLLRHGSAPTSR